MKMPSRAEIERLRERYPAGTTIELVSMDDLLAPPRGTKGRVVGVDDAGSLLVRWDTGSSLNLIPEVDDLRIVRRQSANDR